MPAATDNLTHFKQMQDSTRRPIGDGVLHPDQCPSLKLQGIPWAIPPRGQRLAPSFGPDGKISVATNTTDEWPEVEAVIERIDLPSKEICPTCGHPTDKACDVTESLLEALFALATRALRAQYDLSDASVAELLSFESNEAPEWITTILHWMTGTPPESSVVDPLANSPESWGGDMQAMWGMPDIPMPAIQESSRPHKRGRRRRRRNKKRA